MPLWYWYFTSGFNLGSLSALCSVQRFERSKMSEVVVCTKSGIEKMPMESEVAARNVKYVKMIIARVLSCTEDSKMLFLGTSRRSAWQLMEQIAAPQPSPAPSLHDCVERLCKGYSIYFVTPAGCNVSLHVSAKTLGEE